MANKPKVLAYLRVSTDTQDLNTQRLAILEWANPRGIRVESWIEATISSRKSLKERRIEELLNQLNSGDTLLVSELSRLGRSTAEIIELVNEFARREINLIVVKQGIEIKAGNKQNDYIDIIRVLRWSILVFPCSSSLTLVRFLTGMINYIYSLGLVLMYLYLA